MDDFYFEGNIRIPATIQWHFNLGMYQIVINDVVITRAASVSFREEGPNFHRLVASDHEGNVMAFFNISGYEEWVFEVSKYPQFHLYHLNVHKEMKGVIS